MPDHIRVVRSTLAPYYRKDRKQWFPRGTYPTRDEITGQVVFVRDYKGPGRASRADCQADCDRLNRELELAASAGAPEMTFAEAALAYVQHGGAKRFLLNRDGSPAKLLAELADCRVDKIDNAVMAKVAAAIYATAHVKTLNRQLYTPVVAVLNLAARGKPWKPALQRPKGYAVHLPAKSPRDDWFIALRPACKPQLWALILFDAIHGRRAGEAMDLKPTDYDPAAGTVLISKTKTNEPVFIRLAASVIEAIGTYDWRAGPGLFGHYTRKNRRNLYRDLALACERAGVPYYTPHQAGRHAFARRLLAEGYSLKHVQQAGKWKSMVVASLYGAFEHSEVDDETRRVGQSWAETLGKGGAEVIPLKRKG